MIDDVDFNDVPYINRYHWLQREYMRMVNKNALLLSQQKTVRKRKKSRGA